MTDTVSRRSRRWATVLVGLTVLVTAVGIGPSVRPAAAQVVEPCRYGLLSNADGGTTSDPFPMPVGTRYTIYARSSGRAANGTGQVLFTVDVKGAGGALVRDEDFLHQVFPEDPPTLTHSRGRSTPFTMGSTPPGPFTVSVRPSSGNPFPPWFTVDAWLEVLVPEGECPYPESDDIGSRNGGDTGSDGEAGDPVSTSTGNLFHRLPVPGDQALWAPTYNSLDQWQTSGANGKRGVFGTKWASLLDVRSVATSTDDPAPLYVRLPSGRTFVAEASGVDAWVPPADMVATSLVRNPTTGIHTWTFRSGAVWTFDALGFLVAAEDELGTRLEIARTAAGVPTRLTTIHHGTPGRAWTFVDTGDVGLIDDVIGPFDADLVTPPAGTPRTHLGYTGNQLMTVSAPHRAGDPVVTAEAYTYGVRARLETITQHRGPGLAPVVAVTTTYDAFDRVDQQTTGTGEVDDFGYDRDGDEWITTVAHHAGPTVETVVYRHDASLRLIGVEDPYAEDLAWTWSGDRPETATARGGGETFLGWDADKRFEGVMYADPDTPGQQSGTGSVTVTYCGPGDPRPVDVTNAAGVVTRTWWTTGADPYACEAGRSVPVKVTHAQWTVSAANTTYTSVGGLVTSKTDPDGVRTDFTWEPGRGLLLSSTDFPNGPTNPGRTTYYGYDDAGRQLVIRDPGGVETWTVRDAAGRVVQQVGPTAVTRTCAPTSCTFGTTPPAGPTRSWSYDLQGDLLTATDEAGEVTTRSVTYPAGGGRVETVTAPPHGDDVADPLSQVATVTTSTYDRFDRLVTETRGVAGDLATTTYTYDPLGRLRQMSRDVGGAGADLVESYAYDADGNQTHVVHGPDPTDTDRAIAVRRFDLRGRLVEEWGPTGDTSAPASVSGAAAAPVRQHRQWVYDPADRLLATIEGDGAEQQTTFHRYDHTGRLRYVIVDRDGDQDISVPVDGGPTDPTDSVTEYGYTAAGRLAEVVASPVSATTFDWFAGSSANKRPTTYDYDDAGQLISTTDPNLKVTTQQWDARGQLQRVTVPGGYWTEYGYDAAGRTTRVTNPSPTGTGTVDVLTGYDPRGLVTSETDPHPSGSTGAPTRTFTHHDDGSLATATNALGGPTGTVRYAYDARGNRTARSSWTRASSVAAPHQVVDTWGYDLADRQISEQLAGAGGPTTTAYDPLTGRADVVTQPSGRVTTTEHWNSGLVRSVTTTKPADANGPADTHRVCSWYDTVGQERHTLDDDLAGTSCTAGAVTTQTWTPAGTLASVTAPDTSLTPAGVNETLGFVWDLTGRLRAINHPDGVQLRWAYGRSGQLVRVDRPATSTDVAVYTYDSFGRLRSEKTGDGAVTRTWTLHANGSPQPRRLVEAAVGEATRTTDVTYRADGRVGAETTDGRTLTWSYDAAGQVTGRTDTAGPDHGYTYGPRGLRLSETIDGVTRTSTYDDAARLLSTTGPSGTTTYGYDADGRRATVSPPAPAAPRHTTYDARGLPVEIDLDGTDVQERTYDARGRLVEIAETGAATQAQVWSPVAPTWQPVIVRDPTGHQRVEHGLGGVVSVQDDGGAVTPYRQDRQESTTTSVPAPSAPAVYEPFGQGGDPAAVAGYRGERLLAGLLHLRHRDYDPTTGTFTTRDPLDGIVGTPTETNPYHYADNDPANKEDPLGLSPEDDDWEPPVDPGSVCNLIDALGGGADAYREWKKTRPQAMTIATPGGGGAVQPIDWDTVSAICETLEFAADTFLEVGNILNDSGGSGDDDDGDGGDADGGDTDDGGDATEPTRPGEQRVFTHFTDEAGATGITGIDPLPIGTRTTAAEARFAAGSNPFLSDQPGDIFVTDLGPDLNDRELASIGVLPDRRSYAISFSAETAFASGVRPTPSGRSGIYTMPAGSVIRGRIDVVRRAQ